MLQRRTLRRPLLYGAAALGLVVPITAAPGAPAAKTAPINLETLTGLQAEKMLADGKITSVQLVKSYMDRIEALNKRGPGLNAVTQMNPAVLDEAAAADKRRASGHLLGPADGLPILLKDLIDVKGMYTSAGNYSLRNSYPATDSGIVTNLRKHGVVILGKLGLSEYANSFGNQPSGFSNLTGQVLNGIDADQNPSGSSSGTGAAMAAAMSTLGIGTETSGSIISPSNAQSLVGLRPTVGLVPGFGIAPISVSQDTAGPMVRSVADAAMTLQSIAGAVPGDTEFADLFGPNYYATGIIPKPPDTLPDYMKALDLNFVKGKKIGYNGTLTPGSPLQMAYDALVAAGAIMVPRPVTTVAAQLALPTGYEQHATIDEYYKRLGPKAPIQSLVQEVAVNAAEAAQALKFGNATHLNNSQADITPGGANEFAYRNNMIQRKGVLHKAIDDMMDYTNSDPTQAKDPVIAILGSTPSSPQAGYPQLTIPMGYVTTTRRAQNISVNGGAYDEYDLIGVAYVIEHATHLRMRASIVSPSMYRCAATVPAPPFAKRGHCNPSYDSVMKLLGGKETILPFSLEMESVQSLTSKLSKGTLTSEQLVRAYLTRIALTNAEGPATQAVRAINPAVLADAKAADKARAKGGTGALLGIPVLLDDSIDVKGMPTTGGSIALQDNMPAADSTIAAKLKDAGAVIIGKTNVTEMNGLFDTNIPEGYSSLGGQVLLPSDTDKTPAGSSGGSAAATSSGLAAMTVGMETSTDTAQLIGPAAAAGVVGLKPTVGLVSSTGVLPVAKTQDAPGPIAKTVFDAATELNTIVGGDGALQPLAGSATPVSYTSGLTTGALQGKKIAVLANIADPYPAVVNVLQHLGATVTVVTVGTPSPNPASIVASEFRRDLNNYLGSGHKGGASTLQGIIDYNIANPFEGLKYQQGELVVSQAIDLTNPVTQTAYGVARDSGRQASRNVIDAILGNGTATSSDDYDAIMVPTTDTTIGIADRAGYPVLTLPVGYGATTSGAGHNPVGIALIGPAFSEAALLADGFAIEQATNVRIAPSVTNPSMWRCVPGSAFFTSELCNPGDRQLVKLSAKVSALSSLVGAMHLKGGMVGGLGATIDAIGSKINQPPVACSSLGTLVQSVMHEVGEPSPGILVAQAAGVVSGANGIEATLGCTYGTTARASAEQGVLGMIGAINEMHVKPAVANPLRRVARDVGKRLANHTVASACQTLDVFSSKVAKSAGSGLTSTQASQLQTMEATISSEMGCS